jgi:hypothetical protein
MSTQPDPFAPPSDVATRHRSTEVDPLVGPWATPSGTVGFTSGTAGPAVCAHCASEEVSDAPVVEHLGHMPWYGYIALLFGGIPFLIAPFSLYRRATIGVYLCDAHAKRRTIRRMLKPAVLWSLFVVSLVLAGATNSMGLLVTCVLLLAIAAYRVPRGLVGAKRIDASFVEGLAPAYVQRLPPMPPSMLSALQSDIPDLD